MQSCGPSSDPLSPPTPPFPLETEKGEWVFSESGSEHVENADESNDSEHTSTDYKPTFHF